MRKLAPYEVVIDPFNREMRINYIRLSFIPTMQEQISFLASHEVDVWLAENNANVNTFEQALNKPNPSVVVVDFCSPEFYRTIQHTPHSLVTFDIASTNGHCYTLFVWNWETGKRQSDFRVIQSYF